MFLPHLRWSQRPELPQCLPVTKQTDRTGNGNYPHYIIIANGIGHVKQIMGDTLLGKHTMLNFLWWEWPPSHWQSLHEGTPGNFLRYSDKKLTPKTHMDEAQKKGAAAFVDELQDLEVLTEVPPDAELCADGLLKVIPKPGQLGEWRVLSDMRKGEQNNHIAADPAHTLFDTRGVLRGH
eukprot:15339243-Ditylum_brightwellii.AAC.2